MNHHLLTDLANAEIADRRRWHERRKLIRSVRSRGPDAVEVRRRQPRRRADGGS
jgi:hypothetical protein